MARYGWRAGTLAAALALCSLAGCGGAAPRHKPAPPAGPVVTTADGAVRGRAGQAVDEFLGIPYAAPPVGSLRWRPPQPAARWPGVRAATRFAPHCPQGLVPGFGVASTTENCLYLNVFAPAGRPRAAPGRPVLVWFHGGSLTSGESDDYDPAGLVHDGAIVVTVNYRLGALGFLAHPALAARPGGPSGNYGLMDQQAAMRWVQRNIARFGGNPRQVTIVGQSAGGLSVLAQLASPPARGLFSGAIVESGTYQLGLPSLTRAEAAGRSFATDTGCHQQTAACLRSLPVATILQVQDHGYVPDVDGQVLTRSLAAALASGHFSHVPVINGSNHDEGRLDIAASAINGDPVTAANYRGMIAATVGVPAAAAAAIAAHYPLTAYASPAVALGAVSTDAAGACPAITTDQWLSRYVPVYAYEFSDEHAPERFQPPAGFPYGAAHGSEIQYLLGLPAAPFPGALSGAQQRLAATMKQYWVNFAGHQSPATARVWPRFSHASHRMLSLVPPQPQTETNFATAHHCSFWGSFRP